MCATTVHALSGASLAHHDPPRAHARPPRGTCDERVARAASRQHRGSAAAACTDKQSVSAPTWKHADCGQLSTEWRREVASRGSRHAGRGAERAGEGWWLTCVCRALRFAVGGAVEGRSRRRGASGAAPRFLGRCYGHAPRHPALLGVAEGGRRRGRDRRADRRRQGGWERSGEAAFAAVRRSQLLRRGRWLAGEAPLRVRPPAPPLVRAAPGDEPFCGGDKAPPITRAVSIALPAPASRADTEQRDGAASTGLGIRCQNRAGERSRRTRFLRIRPGGELRYRLRCWFWARF